MLPPKLKEDGLIDYEKLEETALYLTKIDYGGSYPIDYRFRDIDKVNASPRYGAYKWSCGLANNPFEFLIL